MHMGLSQMETRVLRVNKGLNNKGLNNKGKITEPAIQYQQCYLRKGPSKKKKPVNQRFKR